MRCFSSLFLLLVVATSTGIPPALGAGGGCVILLHGLGRTAFSMTAIENELEQYGYRVWNETYPSRQDSIETLAPAAINPGLSHCRDQDAARVHFVTHSMGGILVRHYLQQQDIAELGRIVMLSPPNQGSEIVDLLREYYLYQAVMGPAAQQLGTGDDSLPKSLPPIRGEIGIITGDRSADVLFSDLIPGEDDGKVSVESARLEEMVDFLVVDEGHTFIMHDKDVISQVLHFLEHGRFRR
jgi:pimeloyl-ACP methyl ester carboxylesterase